MGTSKQRIAKRSIHRNGEIMNPDWAPSLFVFQGLAQIKFAVGGHMFHVAGNASFSPLNHGRYHIDSMASD
jgi:hypothetical protein